MFVPRCNPSRWSLGASALVALAIAGCGSGTQRHASLHPSAEKRLLSLVARARDDAARRDGTAVHAVLGEFVSEVKTLKRSGQLGDVTATKLERAAHTTAAHAARAFHTSTARAATATGGSQTSTSPGDPSASASGSAPKQPPGHPDAKPGPATKPPPPAPKNGQKPCKHPGQHGKGLGHAGFGKPNCPSDGESSWGSNQNGGEG